MTLETKQVLLRAHVHSLDRSSRNAHDHLEQTISMALCMVDPLNRGDEVGGSNEHCRFDAKKIQCLFFKNLLFHRDLQLINYQDLTQDTLFILLDLSINESYLPW